MHDAVPCTPWYGVAPPVGLVIDWCHSTWVLLIVRPDTVTMPFPLTTNDWRPVPVQLGEAPA